MLTRLARLSRGEGGFTLIELMVVVAIIALLATMAAGRVFEAINTAKDGSAKGELATISGALARYYLDYSKYPAVLEELKDKGYLKQSTTFKNKFDKRYLYAVNDLTTPTAYVLADPSNKPQTFFAICKGEANRGKVPEGSASQVYWKSGTGTGTLALELRGTSCSTALTSIPDSLSTWAEERNDLFTE